MKFPSIKVRRFYYLALGMSLMGCLALGIGLKWPRKDSRPESPRANKERRGEREDQPDAWAKFYLLKRLPAGETGIPMERYFTAVAQMRQMTQYSTAQNSFLPPRAQMSQEASQLALALGTWTWRGPGNIGGRTRALLIHPTTPSIMYAGGVDGGVWKTTNSGASWSPLADLMANLAISSLVMDPANPNIIYAGTGEGYFNIDAVRGAGIFKTTDGGTNWTRLATTNTSDFYFVNDIVVSPVNSQRVYAATRTGVWRSVDGGTNWTQVLNLSGVTGGAMDLAIRTDQTTDYVFATAGNFVQATIYRNLDAGGAGTWNSVYTEAGMGRTSLAIAPSNQNVIYALSASIAAGNYQDGLQAVFRSTSSGDSGTWTTQVRNTNATKLNTVQLTNPVFAFYADCGFVPPGPNEFFNQGWYDNVIAVDPADSNRVWTGGIDLFRSDDGGANWGQASHWWADPGNPHLAHADQHRIVFHPQYNGTTNKVMFVGNDGGIFRTDDARAATATGAMAPCSTNNGSVSWVNLNNNYGVTQFYHGVPYPSGTTYFGGTQDNGTVRGTNAGGPNAWAEIQGGDGGYVAVDPTNTNTLYAEFTGFSITKSTDGGVNFNDAMSGITGDSGALFITPFTMDSSNAQRLWTGGNYLWRTTNGAGSWTRASAITNGSVSAIAVAPTNANNVLAGLSNGFIYRTNIGLTSNSATTWPSIQPRSGYVSWVTFDPTNANIAYATYSTFGGTHVWKSIDAGATWNGLDGTGGGTLPDLPVHCIVVDPSNTSRLYIGTDLGVFTSTDGGLNWAVENTGFANVVTESLAVNGNSLFAFTHGRGAWSVPILVNCPTITVSPAAGALTGGTVNTFYSQLFTQVGGVGTTTFSVSAGSVPTNLMLNPNTGLLSGTPTAFGNFSFTITATDANGCTGSTAYTLQIVPANCTYSIAPSGQNFTPAGGGGMVTITTQSGCPWVVTGVPFWMTIQSGGTGSLAVNYMVAPNNTGLARTAMLTVAGQPFTVSQTAQAADDDPPAPDFNGDGKADIAGRHGVTANIQVGLSNGTKFLSSTTWGTWNLNYDLHFADANGDGKADIIGRRSTTGDVQVGLSDGTKFLASTSWGNWSLNYDLHLADVNGDGRADLVGRQMVTGDIQVALSTGSSFQAPTSWGNLSLSYDLHLADVNGDGRADIVGRHGVTGDIQVGLSTGSNFQTSTSWGNLSLNYDLHLADVDGGGRADIIGRHAVTANIQVGLSTGSSFQATTSWGSWNLNYDLHFANMDGDANGRADISGRRVVTADVQVGLSDGTKFLNSSSWGSWNLNYDLHFASADIGGGGGFSHQPSARGGQAGLANSGGARGALSWRSWVFIYSKVVWWKLVH